jgi:hypothetical protein
MSLISTTQMRSPKMPRFHAYVMRDQVRDQIRSIMEEENPRPNRDQLAAHLFATGLVAFFYALLVAISR